MCRFRLRSKLQARLAAYVFSDVPSSEGCLRTLSGEGSSGPVRSMTGDVVGTVDTGVMVRSEEPAALTLQGPMCDEESAVLRSVVPAVIGVPKCEEESAALRACFRAVFHPPGSSSTASRSGRK